jgi:hypothetical protein
MVKFTIWLVVALVALVVITHALVPQPVNTTAKTETRTPNHSYKMAEYVDGDYFSYCVWGWARKKQISSSYDVYEPSGNGRFIDVAISIQNTNTESRLLREVELHVNSDGRTLKFDKRDLLMGYNSKSYMITINPEQTVHINMVFTIPSHIKGDMYIYIPSTKKRIYLGRCEDVKGGEPAYLKDN